MPNQVWQDNRLSRFLSLTFCVQSQSHDLKRNPYNRVQFKADLKEVVLKLKRAMTFPGILSDVCLYFQDISIDFSI